MKHYKPWKIGVTCPYSFSLYTCTLMKSHAWKKYSLNELMSTHTFKIMLQFITCLVLQTNNQLRTQQWVKNKNRTQRKYACNKANNTKKYFAWYEWRQNVAINYYIMKLIEEELLNLEQQFLAARKYCNYITPVMLYDGHK